MLFYFTMRKLILIGLCVGISIIGLGQGYKKKSPEEKARKYTDEFLAVIPLDKATEEKVFQINVTVSKQFDSLYANKPDPNEIKKAYAIIFKGRDSAFKSVLTKQQYLMYDDWQRELREKRQREKEAKEKAAAEKTGNQVDTTGNQPRANER